MHGGIGKTHARFTATRWSIVAAATKSRQSDASRRALEELARTYWPPLYAFIRRQGNPPAEAEDLTQEFFAQLLQRDSLSAVDASRGRFRSFLLAAATHFLSNQRDRQRAIKRGGRQHLIALDAMPMEQRIAVASSELTPERAFERQWALSVLDQVLARLRAEYEAAGKTSLFADLKPALVGDSEPYAQIAARYGMGESAVKMAVHRLRRRYRELLHEEIAQTVADEREIDGEIRYLMKCL
jgi:RNA polymerase sigma-70 factor (ECF subfamily)